MTSALLALEDDEELRERERGRVRHLFVDDAHHLDPLQVQLIRTIGHTAEEFVVAGDPDQSVFSFRGADPKLFADSDNDGDRTVMLTTSHRLAPTVRAAVAKLGATLPGASPHRKLVTPQGKRGGKVRVRLMPTPAAEASWIADQLRRAHLVDGVPWSEMAVLVRSPARTFLVLQRALRAAGCRSVRPLRNCRWRNIPRYGRCWRCCGSRRSRNCWTSTSRKCCCPRRSAGQTPWRCGGCGAVFAGWNWLAAGSGRVTNCWWKRCVAATFSSVSRTMRHCRSDA